MRRIRPRIRQLMCLFLILTSMLLGLSSFRNAKAGMTMFSISPATGYVGANVTLTANITTANGPYNVTFDSMFQTSGIAVGNNVSVTLPVPEAISGMHNVTVVDAKTGDSVAGEFNVTTLYLVNATVPPPPGQLQEGDSVPISLTVTGGNATGTANVTVTVQTPASTNYNKQVSVKTSSSGSGNATLTYPTDFAQNANTSYVGNYNVTLDVSTLQATFTVGLTNSTSYHRSQAVNVKALYGPSENVTLTISGKTGLDTLNLTADSSGVVEYSNFTVPTNAMVGDQYNVTIISISGNPKYPPDTQNFTVPGFEFNVTAKNLAGETVSGVGIDAFENKVSVSNQTTDSQGLAMMMLETGNYTLQSFYTSNLVPVGASPTPYSVPEITAVDIVCNLTNLNVQVSADINGSAIGLPEVAISLTPGSSNTTDISGNTVIHSLLPNQAYNLTASRYGDQFNLTSLPNLLGINGSLLSVFYLNVTCPPESLKIDVLKADGQPFIDANVQIKELSGGIYYPGTTDSNGTVIFSDAVFGSYVVEIRDSTGLLLNSTNIDLFQDQNVTVSCSLFGLSITVKVTDYFGQPFANTNVTLLGNDSAPVSERTQSNGVATFENLVGSSFSVSVTLSDNGSPSVVRSLVVVGSTTVSIVMGKYILLAGFPVEADQLAVAIVIILTVLLILLLEIYRKRQSKSRKIDG